MYLLNALTVAAFIAQAAAQQKACQGFNSGGPCLIIQLKSNPTLRGYSRQHKHFLTHLAPSTACDFTQMSNLAHKIRQSRHSLHRDEYLHASGNLVLRGNDHRLGADRVEGGFFSQYGQPFADLVIGISVGSEVLYRASGSSIANGAGIGAGLSVIVDLMKQVRSAIGNTALSKKPVGHVDWWSAWLTAQINLLLMLSTLSEWTYNRTTRKTKTIPSPM
jgi:hypothetical protein